MKNKIIFFIVLLGLYNTGNSEDALNKYLQIAAENNPGLKAKFYTYMASLDKVPQVSALPDPQLAFGYFIQPIETRVGPQQSRFSFSQMFPWFGTLGTKKEIAVQNAKVKYEEFEDAKSHLFFEIKSAYYHLYFIQKSVQITNDNLRILKTFRDLAMIKIESGASSAVNGLHAEMVLADFENMLARLEDQLHVHSIQFNNLLNQKEDHLIEIPASISSNDFSYSLHAALDSVRANNHLLSRLDYLIKSSQSQETLAKKSGMPRFSIGVDYILIDKSDNPMIDANASGQDAILFPKIGMTLPLYRNKYKALVKEAGHQQQVVQAQRDDKINALETIFEKAFKEYMDADRRILLYQNQSQLAEKALNILEIEYATDGKNFEEVLRMEKQYLKYKLELERAYSDKQASIAFMTYLMGR